MQSPAIPICPAYGRTTRTLRGWSTLILAGVLACTAAFAKEPIPLLTVSEYFGEVPVVLSATRLARRVQLDQQTGELAVVVQNPARDCIDFRAENVFERRYFLTLSVRL